MKLSFYGASQQISGSCYLLESDTSKLLVDCGLFQCQKVCEAQNHEPFPFDPAKITGVVVTHAHTDHTGRIPKLFKDGFKGKVYSTPPTKDLAAIMLADSLSLMIKEAEREEGPVLFSQDHVDRALANWETHEYGHEFRLDDFHVRLLDAGHVLGSAMIEILFKDKDGVPQKIVFSGDLGNPPIPLLPPPAKVTDANILVVETTYGNRSHEMHGDRKIKLERAIEETVKKKGVLMIPAFSLERTQEILFELHDLIENGRVPHVPVFLDSPLAIRITEIYRKYDHYFNKKARYIIDSGDKIFKFSMLTFTLATEESKAINDVSPPKIIIAGSGMSTGGRILHHERRYLPDPNSILLLVGYQAAGSLGRKIQDGAKEVDIFGNTVPVRAQVVRIQGYSAHPDQDGLMEFVHDSYNSLEKVFAVHGEPDASLFFVQRIRDYMGIHAYAPHLGESFDI
ncbi:MAG: MBL fold metallo-hydrolase [Candidatus Niyogibacteria bacterium]|nr:MBL fold metallo-hydrolase [Candidatus Niyogibacteria bacterium]